ncbi:MAG: transketolase [Gammaproteobacteria bacterium RIFCSPHIGHO2_12_FULL_41_20]|nr:MAG: transketolase [Gammaproteobacteria bacterium RIFCSPHIGHO2_12_FULL_41_20]
MPTRRELANAIRFLSIDAVQKANSGHPGMPMGMADIAEALWSDYLQHNPANPHWWNRDRFVLSNGHGCMLQYALLHLTGYALTIEDLKQFRQLHSKTPGHPEYGDTPGVETTTGPLGQGLANGVGMAIAEKHLAALFNREGFPIIDHFTYVFAGDGCLMEGISHEVCSLAGTLGLGKLIVFYDDNGISIDGDVQSWFTDDTAQRFAAYHWHVVPQVDGHDSEALKQAIAQAQAVTDKPSLIHCKTVIGWGAPNLAGKAETHGAPLGEKEIAAVREQLHWPYAPFDIPQSFYTAWDARQQGARHEATWQQLFNQYTTAYPELAKELTRRMQRQLPEHWATTAESWVVGVQQKKEPMATRKASQLCLSHYAKILPELFGGSADLTESNCSLWNGAEPFSRNHPTGRYLHYGVREFGMSAILNGMALYGGIIPYAGTFLTFSDYARNAVRLAAIMRQRVIFLYSHDSIGLGEDGPTHQPIEHLPSLRMIPQLSVWRPCDVVESAVAWRKAIEYAGPTCLLLSRQTLPFQERHPRALAAIHRGGYILQEEKAEPDLIFIATGSEVAIAVEAAKLLRGEKLVVRIVSMPSVDTFLAQELTYQQSVLPPNVTKRIVIEAAATEGWYRFVGFEGKVIGVDRFGASAPAKDVFRDCGITVEHVVATAKAMVAKEIA